MWGGATSGMRAKVHSKNEDVFFPGGLILVLALVGIAAGAAYTRKLRAGLLLGMLVCSVLALGMGLTGAGYPYRLLYDYAPGWDGVRVPGRIFTLATLFYALLAGAGAQLLATWLGALGQATLAERAAGARWAWRSDRHRSAKARGTSATRVVPQPARAEVGLPGRCWTCPPTAPMDRIWQYFSTDGFYKIPVGNSTFDMPAVDDLRGGMSGFPDRASVEKLRYYGIRTVVLHTEMPKLPGMRGYATRRAAQPAAAAAKPIAGLGVTRRRVGSFVIYRDRPRACRKARGTAAELDG